jgi:hypothetical protein
MKHNHEQLSELIGLYVLGGLEPSERRAFDQHLRDCPECTAELARLECLPALLDGVPREVALELAQPSPSDVEHNTKRLLSELHMRRRQQRRRVAGLVALVAAASLVIGAVAGPAVTGPRQVKDSYTMSASSGLEVQLDLVHKGWGTELAMDGERLPDSGVLSLWVTDSTGKAHEVATWKATQAGRARLSAATAVETEEIVRVEIKDADKVPVASVVTRG